MLLDETREIVNILTMIHSLKADMNERMPVKDLEERNKIHGRMIESVVLLEKHLLSIIKTSVKLEAEVPYVSV